MPVCAAIVGIKPPEILRTSSSAGCSDHAIKLDAGLRGGLGSARTLGSESIDHVGSLRVVVAGLLALRKRWTCDEDRSVSSLGVRVCCLSGFEVVAGIVVDAATLEGLAFTAETAPVVAAVGPRDLPLTSPTAGFGAASGERATSRWTSRRGRR